jgi:hypothetical protein
VKVDRLPFQVQPLHDNIYNAIFNDIPFGFSHIRNDQYCIDFILRAILPT